MYRRNGGKLSDENSDHTPTTNGNIDAEESGIDIFHKAFAAGHMISETGHTLKQDLNEKAFTCSVCDKSHKCLDHLERHMSDKHPSESDECNINDITPNFDENYDKSGTEKSEDSSQNTTPKDTEAVNIKVKVEDSYSRAMHELSHKSLSCSYCDKVFTKHIYVKLHERTHTQERPHVCPICNKGFKRPSCLFEHKFVHTNERPLNCKTCDKAFKSRRQLKDHRCKNLKFSAFHCLEKTRAQKKNQNKRPISKTTEVYVEEPKDTETSETNVKGLSNEFHHEITIKPEPVKEDIRDTMEVEPMADSDSMNKTQVEIVKPNTLAQLELVTVYFQGEKKVFKCNLCPEKFQTKEDAKEHFLTHPKLDILERISQLPSLFACTFCPKKFLEKESCENHVRSFHTKEKLFQCKYLKDEKALADISSKRKQ